MSKRALHGVNLGGWLVLERWMTPSVFAGMDVRDERGLAATDEGVWRIKRHRETFITEADFVWLVQRGVELVRIPFGYWLLDGGDGYVAGIERLDWAMQMAEKYELKVLLDMHALPGSQNGKIHSGDTRAAGWFDSAELQQRSLELCERYAARYKDSPALWGFEVINEPRLKSVHDYVVLRRYYRSAYRRLQKIVPKDVYIVFSDAFVPWLWCGAMGWRRQAMMDVHFYATGRKLTSGVRRAVYVWWVRGRRWRLPLYNLVQPVIIGEWSMVLPRSATQSVDKAQAAQYRAQLLRHQLVAYRPTQAWCYWSYKTEPSGGWNYRSVVESESTKTYSEVIH